MTLQDSFSPKLADLGGEPTPIDLQKIRQLLAVKGDLKAIAFLSLGALHQVGDQLFPGGTLRGNIHLLMKQNGFRGKILHQVEDQLLMVPAPVGTGMKNVAAIHKQNLRRLIRHHRHGDRLGLGAGKRLGK